MSEEPKEKLRLEIAHVLFIDIVGYSTHLTDEQQALVDQLNQIVRSSAVFQKAEAADRLIKIPTGDGMALIFYNSPEQPVECALDISRELKWFPDLPVRMGVHSGPVSAVTDLNDRTNAAGIGINIAQRVMDCGDAGHILLSKACGRRSRAVRTLATAAARSGRSGSETRSPCPRVQSI